jgi:hypothetical protein
VCLVVAEKNKTACLVDPLTNQQGCTIVSHHGNPAAAAEQEQPSTMSAILGSVLLNEFAPNPASGDPTNHNFELKGLPGPNFGGGCIFTVECGDDYSITSSAPVTAGSFDNDGLLSVSIPDIADPSFMVMLTTAVFGDGGTHCPTLNDSAVNLFNFNNVYDGIVIAGSVVDEALCDFDNIDPPPGFSLTGLPVFPFVGTAPGDDLELVFRDGVSEDWYGVNTNDSNAVFGIDEIQITLAFDKPPQTPAFGSANPTVDFPWSPASLPA